MARLMDAFEPVDIGSDFLGYRIEELIGRGGMGVVYRAYDLRLKRPVALKLVAPSLARDDRFRARFARESELVMSLEHPTVVPIYDAGDVDGRVYLAMRLVDGSDLGSLLRTKGALEPARAVAICAQIAAALDAAHASGLVHRDVKPSNVLLDASEHVYLADFGLTRRLDDEWTESGLDRSIGTPAYLAPEQLEAGPIDGSADVYSLGCVLYECLTGEAVFPRDSRLAVAWAHLEDEPPRPSRQRPDLPEAIDAVIARALAKEPAKRYPTCGALAAAAGHAVAMREGGTLTLLFTDIEGSTQLLKRLGSARYGDLLSAQQRLVREAIAVHHGSEVDTQGDSFFVAFRSASDAVTAAVAIQRALAGHRWPDGVAVRVRIGIHSGEAAGTADRYVGFSVHRAARIGAAAHGGQVLASDATRVLVEDELPEGVSLRDLGLYRLKDIDRPERIVQVEAEGLPKGFPPLRGADRVKTPVHRRRSLIAPALAGVLAAAVAIPVFALGATSSGSLPTTVAAPVPGNSVGVYDPVSNKLVEHIPLGSRPSSVATGHGSLWVANVDDDSVSEINPRTNRAVPPIRVGNGPSGIAIGGRFVWVANYLGRSISQIDPRLGQVVHTIPLDGTPSGVAYGGGKLWVADESNRSVLPINPVTDKPGKPIQVAAGAAAIAFGSGNLWVAGQNTGTITKVDPSSRNQQPINVGNGPTAIAYGAGSVWVANSVDGTVSQIGSRSNQVKQTFRVGTDPSALAVAPDGSSVWVANTGSGTVSRIDPQRNQPVQTLETGNHPTGIGLAGTRVYLAVSAVGHRGGTLTVVADGIFEHDEAELLDPALSYVTGGWQALAITNDGLLTFQRAGGSAGTHLVPDLATSLPTPTDHGTTYTFQLRSGIRYSNGQTVRPGDFRRAIERAIAYQPAEGGGPGSTYFAGIVGAAACLKAPNKPCDLSRGIVTGANTVSFHLVKPDPDFLFKLAEPTAYAEPANTPLAAKVPLPATGPYEIASYHASKSRDVLRLVRNPYFREWSAAAQPSGYPDRIVDELRNVSVADNVRAVLAGKADLTLIDTPVPSSLDLSLHTRYAAQLHTEPALATYWYLLNTRVPPFNNLDARRAVALAVDRNRLAQLNGGRDLYAPNCQLLPPGVDGYSRYCASSRPDLAQAKRLVAASGTKGAAVVLNFGAAYAEHSPFATYMRSLLSGLGYRARIHVVSLQQYAQEANDPRYKWQTQSTGFYADWPTASTFFSEFTCAAFHPNATNYNFTEFCDHGLDAQIAKAQSLQLTNPQAAGRIWAQVDRRIVDQASVVPLLTPQNVNLASSRVGNYVYSPWLAAPLLDLLWVR